MKDTEKQKEVADGDYQIVAEALGLSSVTVRMVSKGWRKDHHNIRKALLIVSRHREISRRDLINKLSKLTPKTLA